MVEFLDWWLVGLHIILEGVRSISQISNQIRNYFVQCNLILRMFYVAQLLGTQAMNYLKRSEIH